MNDISSLPFFLNYHIYSFLLPEDKKAWAYTNKHFHKFVKQTYQIEKFAKKVTSFIQENYQITYSTLQSSDIKRFFFYPVNLLMLGETHSKDEHRYLNAKLIHMCWRIDSTLFVEGDRRTFETFRQSGKGQFEYLDKDIVEHSRPWDIQENPKLIRFIRDYCSFARSTFKIAKAMMALSFDEKDFSLCRYLGFIHRYFDQIQHKEIYRGFPFLFQARCYAVPSQVLHMLKYQTLCLILAKQQFLAHAYDKILLQFCRERDNSLINNISESIFFQNGSSIYLSGQWHVQRKEVISKTSEFHKAYKQCQPGSLNDAMPILFLVPLENIDKDSVDRSFQTHFCKPTVNNMENQTERQDEGRLDSIAFIKDRIQQGDEKTFDANKNHFGMWLEYSFTYLQYERDQTEYFLANSTYSHDDLMTMLTGSVDRPVAVTPIKV